MAERSRYRPGSRHPASRSSQRRRRETASPVRAIRALAWWNLRPVTLLDHVDTQCVRLRTRQAKNRRQRITKKALLLRSEKPLRCCRSRRLEPQAGTDANHSRTARTSRMRAPGDLNCAGQTHGRRSSMGAASMGARASHQQEWLLVQGPIKTPQTYSANLHAQRTGATSARLKHQQPKTCPSSYSGTINLVTR